MAVGAEQREILDGPGLLAADVQWLDVVALDITLSALAVLLGEVEHAHLAGERTAVGQHTADLLTTQSGIALSVGMEA